MNVLKSVTVNLTLFLVLTSTVSTESTDTTVPFRDHNTRIVNGFEAKPGQFPHQALVEIETSSYSALCGGSLLNNEWVLLKLIYNEKYLKKTLHYKKLFITGYNGSSLCSICTSY